jgi:hypothetical protein
VKWFKKSNMMKIMIKTFSNRCLVPTLLIFLLGIHNIVAQVGESSDDKNKTIISEYSAKLPLLNEISLNGIWPVGGIVPVYEGETM